MSVLYYEGAGYASTMACTSCGKRSAGTNIMRSAVSRPKDSLSRGCAFM